MMICLSDVSCCRGKIQVDAATKILPGLMRTVTYYVSDDTNVVLLIVIV